MTNALGSLGSWETILKAILELSVLGSSASVAFPFRRGERKGLLQSTRSSGRESSGRRGCTMAGYLGLWILSSYIIFGNGLHWEILGGRQEQVFHQKSLIRQKREWIVPPSEIWEERDNSQKNPIAKIRSDKDVEPGEIITYTISGQGVTEPPYHLFVINGKTGELNITGIVDREQTPMFHLKGYAMNQRGENLERPLDLRIKVRDINDNSPVFSQTGFSGSVEELCEVGTLVLKVNATDADEPNTLNSKIAFRIVSQEPNDPNAFVIKQETGEVKTATFQLDREVLPSLIIFFQGFLIYLVSKINYEELQTMDLKIVVSNKAAYHKSIISQVSQVKPISVKINVENVREGPVFKPQTLVIKTMETMKINQIIGSYQAYDEDTQKIAQRITYAKGSDTANWLIIDAKTAEIRLRKVLDYESHYVINGTYTATILAISTDYPPKTATGTIVIQIEDKNDYCPILVNQKTNVCTDTKYINITVEDRDRHPNGGPFTFKIIDEPERISDKWRIGLIVGSRAQLILEDVTPGIYRIPLLIKDKQGFSCPDQQVLEVNVCDCKDGTGCQGRIVNSSVFLGPAAVALMILALLLLLLVPLLLLACGFGSGFGSSGGKGFVAIPDNSEEMLRNWNSEGAAPENKAILDLLTSSGSEKYMSSGEVVVGAGTAAAAAAAAAGNSFSCTIKEQNMSSNTISRWREDREALFSEAEFINASAPGVGLTAGGTMLLGAGRTLAMDTGMIMNEEFLRGYFNEKADAFADEDEVHLAKDCLLIYSQEEEHDSPHGSVGCCSFIDGDFDEHFLDDLGDKFKTLAEICMGKPTGLKTEQFSSHTQKDTTNRSMNGSGLPYSQQQNVVNAEHTYSSGAAYNLSEPVKGFGSETMTEKTITESTVTSKSNLQPVKRIPDPMISSSSSSNVVVTETSYGTVPSTVIREPQIKENVVVTERVLAPASSLHDMLDMPAGVFPDLPDSKYVVVRERERVLVPSSDLKASVSIPNLSEEQNIMITERVVTPTPVRRATTEAGTFPNNERQEQILISDSFFNQSSPQEVLPTGSTLSKSSTVKQKYSTVQYTRS
ncbi:PREDICTED: desmoglein-2-like [Thamnophis sirtalis]|uniref:Desmoglein-2-like n=1 Tax=Thamnophis sirtalis TaxID=35019 RepID=A0A6I9XRL9_9SAUR|nr:PREDICTED: desmoglein-2-like [Thamnophis sirtalis]